MKFYPYKKKGGGGGDKSFSYAEWAGGGGVHKRWGGSFKSGA